MYVSLFQTTCSESNLFCPKLIRLTLLRYRTGPSSSRKTTYFVPFILHPVEGLDPFVTKADQKTRTNASRTARCGTLKQRERERVRIQETGERGWWGIPTVWADSSRASFQSSFGKTAGQEVSSSHCSTRTLKNLDTPRAYVLVSF